MNEMTCVGVILAGGSGKRFGGEKPKQFAQLCGKPVIEYPVSLFESSKVIEGYIIVSRKEDMPFYKEQFCDDGNYPKCLGVVEGGTQRYDSVWNALSWIVRNMESEFGLKISPKSGKSEASYKMGDSNASDNPGILKESNNLCENVAIYIHDGARPLTDEEMLEGLYSQVKEWRAVIPGYLSTDTVKIADENGFVEATPDRKKVWNVQTPQVFALDVVYNSYLKLMEEISKGTTDSSVITDDASVVERYSQTPVRLYETGKDNIKITNPRDLKLAEDILRSKN